METKPKSSRMYPFLVLYDMHTKFFINSIVDIKDEDAHNRLGTKANHAGWIAGVLCSRDSIWRENSANQN